MSALESFLRLVQIDSPADPFNEQHTPSNEAEHNMAKALYEELISLGLKDVKRTEHAYVSATLEASKGAETLPALGLIAHIDSSFDAPAKNVKPQIIHYTGGDLVINKDVVPAIKVSPSELSDLVEFAGQDIICSDGTTLLSADDKAGVAEILGLLERLRAHPELPHPTLKIAFVPDEEIGHGAALLDLEEFGARWAYTVDGEALGEINAETFNAASAEIVIKGVGVHPGSAKNIMINALSVAAEFERLVPADARPEHTEDHEGFFHPIRIEGTPTKCVLSYIIRDHSAQDFERKQEELVRIAHFLNARYKKDTVTISIKEEYRNMAEKLVGLEFLVQNAIDANKEAGLEPKVVAVRGGTDGAALSFRGLPCPNLATGGYNYHSVREFIPVLSLERSVDMLEHLVAKFARPQQGKELS